MKAPDRIFLLPETFAPGHGALLRGELAPPPEAAAELFIAGSASSTFDLAWKLVEMSRLPAWGAALALRQEAGRGQLRRPWFSPEGNLHVSFRLPQDDIFADSAATVILGLLFCEAFADLGLALKLKWPNDLVLERPAETGGAGKLGGILLEEKNGVLVAGVGINAARLPEGEEIRARAALPPAALPQGFVPRSPVRLWLALVQSLIMRYTVSFMAKPRSALLVRAEERLLWCGRQVLVSGETGGEESFCGIITGLSAAGGLMLLTKAANGVPISREVTSGSIAGFEC